MRKDLAKVTKITNFKNEGSIQPQIFYIKCKEDGSDTPLVSENGKLGNLGKIIGVILATLGFIIVFLSFGVILAYDQVGLSPPLSTLIWFYIGGILLALGVFLNYISIKTNGGGGGV